MVSSTFQSSCSIFVTCPIGFEPVLEKELKQHPFLSSMKRGKGGVSAQIENDLFDAIVELNLSLRTANRVLIEIVRIAHPSKPNLYQALFDVNWKDYFPTPHTFAIEVPFSQHPDFKNTMFAAQFMKDAICDRLRKETGSRPSIDAKNPAIRFQALLGDKEAVFYFDSSNEPLFKRGYRSEGGGVAPLKETMAAALLMNAQFDPTKDILIDPCAGSGTFPIEALLMSKKVAPGLLRRNFGYRLHPLYEKSREDAVRKKLEDQIIDDPAHFPCPYAIEREASVFRSLQQAIVRSGCMGLMNSIKADFRSISPRDVKAGIEGEGPTFVVANPPYGVRLKPGAHELNELYADLGKFMKLILGKNGGRGALLVPFEPELARKIGLRYDHAFPVFQGGLECQWLTYTIYSMDTRGGGDQREIRRKK